MYFSPHQGWGREGVMSECLKKIPICEATETLKKIIASNNGGCCARESQNEITEEVTNQIKNISIPKNIGDITLNQIYFAIKEKENSLKNLPIDKISLEPQLAAMLISYGLAARVFNRYVNNQPFKPHLSSEELAAIYRVRNLYKVYWVFSPLMILGLNKLKPSLFKVVININPEDTTNIYDGNKGIEKNLILGFISAYYKKLNKWVRRFLIFITFNIFYISGWFKFLSEGLIYLVLKYKLQVKFLLQLFLIFPIVLSIIALFLLMEVKIKGEITVSKKYPKFVQKLISQLSLIAKKDELYEFYRKMFINWTLIYLFLLIIVIIII